MNKYKQAYRKIIIRKILCGEYLRLILYLGAGISIASFKWYVSIPIATALIFFGYLIESNLEELKEELKKTCLGGKQ